MDLHSQMIFDEYLEKKEIYERVKDLAVEIIEQIIEENRLYVVAVEARTKSPKSLEGKLDLKGSKYDSLMDITDIVGTRVVTFYQDEVDKFAALVEKHFDVDWDDSVDKRKLYADDNADRFGYMSLHYIISIPKSYYYDEEHPEINEIKFEIQMRTALQHVWATSAHDTGYKSDIEIPKKYIRTLNRLAGLLELADDQFSEVINDITEYRRKVEHLVKEGQFHELLIDGDTYKSYIACDPFGDLNKQIAAINRAEIAPVNTIAYIEVFKFLKLKTIADIEQMKKKYSEMAYQLALVQLADTDLDIVASNIGLKNVCLSYIYDHKMGEDGLKQFYDIINGELPINAATAERTLKAFESVNIL